MLKRKAEKPLLLDISRHFPEEFHPGSYKFDSKEWKHILKRSLANKAKCKFKLPILINKFLLFNNKINTLHRFTN